MEKSELIIHEDGTITHRTIRERILDAEPSVLDGLTADVTRTIRNAIQVPGWGYAHANTGLNDTVWSIRIDRIPLHARFRVIEKVLVPVFASVTELEMPLVWRVPEEIRLVFVVQTEHSEGETFVIDNWLFAFHKEGNGYRLPLPNLHDDCRLCAGDFKTEFKSASECVMASLEQFGKSKWNADLMKTAGQSQMFFRFNPTDESFETLPIQAEDWTTLCNKVSTALMERVVVV